MDLKAAHYDIIEFRTDSGDSTTDQASVEEYREITDRFKKAYDSGVNIAFGTDAGVYPHGQNAEQFSLMLDAGMREIDIIKSATITAAELLGKEDEIGSIEIGKLADIIAVKGNPLSDIEVLENIVFVMKEGKIFKKGINACQHCISVMWAKKVRLCIFAPNLASELAKIYYPEI